MTLRRLLSVASFTLVAVLALSPTGCGNKKEEPAVNTPWDPSQLPKGAYDISKKQSQMKGGEQKPGGEQPKKQDK